MLIFVENMPNGFDLWRSTDHIILLEEQVRQAGDPEWAEILQRLRYRVPTDEDIAKLQQRVGVWDEFFREGPCQVIVRRHNVRNAINWKLLRSKSERRRVDITYCIGGIKGVKNMSRRHAAQLKFGSGNLKGDVVLALMPGVPLMLTNNINIDMGTQYKMLIDSDLPGLVNGAIVTFVGLGGTKMRYERGSKTVRDPHYMVVTAPFLQTSVLSPAGELL
jgi:hypothetical protein